MFVAMPTWNGLEQCQTSVCFRDIAKGNKEGWGFSKWSVGTSVVSRMVKVCDILCSIEVNTAQMD